MITHIHIEDCEKQKLLDHNTNPTTIRVIELCNNKTLLLYNTALPEVIIDIIQQYTHNPIITEVINDIIKHYTHKSVDLICTYSTNCVNIIMNERFDININIDTVI